MRISAGSAGARRELLLWLVEMALKDPAQYIAIRDLMWLMFKTSARRSDNPSDSS